MKYVLSVRLSTDDCGSDERIVHMITSHDELRMGAESPLFVLVFLTLTASTSHASHYFSADGLHITVRMSRDPITHYLTWIVEGVLLRNAGIKGLFWTPYGALQDNIWWSMTTISSQSNPMVFARPCGDKYRDFVRTLVIIWSTRHSTADGNSTPPKLNSRRCSYHIKCPF